MFQTQCSSCNATCKITQLHYRPITVLHFGYCVLFIFVSPGFLEKTDKKTNRQKTVVLSRLTTKYYQLFLGNTSYVSKTLSELKTNTLRIFIFRQCMLCCLQSVGSICFVCARCLRCLDVFHRPSATSQP